MAARRVHWTLASAAVCFCIAGQAAPAGQSKPIVAETYHNTFSRAHSVLARIKPGEVVATKTLDASGRDENGTVKARPPNPLTGPFFVEGAEPGDALIVRFGKIAMNRNWGWSCVSPRVCTRSRPNRSKGIYPNRYKPGEIIKERVNVVPWDLDLKRQTVRLREPASGVNAMQFPARPMLGCVGVAPAGDFAPTSSPSGNLRRQPRLQRSRRGHGCHPARSTTLARCCSSAMATRCRETASRRAPASRRRWMSNSPSS